MSNVINFPSKSKQETNEEEGWFIVETAEDTRWAKNLEATMDFLWNEIYSGNEIIDVFADDHGSIHFQLHETGRRGSLALYKKHLEFMIEFVNDKSLARDFMIKYNEFIESTNTDRVLIETKEKSPIPDQEN